jgi:hypothetical protein
MKIGLAFALLTLAAPSAFAQQDPTMLRDQLREIAQPGETPPTANMSPSGSAAATDAKRKPANSQVAKRSINAHESQASILPIGGSYQGEIEVANIGQKPVRYSGQLQFDSQLNRAVISVNYPTAQLVRTINGHLTGNVFRGRSDGGFSGVVYNYAADFVLVFARDHRTVRIRETPLHPPPGYVDDGKATIWNRFQ